MTDRQRLTGDWTPRRQAMAHEQVLDSIARARRTVVDFPEQGTRDRDKALRAAADALLTRRDELVEANQADLADARAGGMGTGSLDRLTLTGTRLAGLAEQLRRLAELPSPLTEEVPSSSRLTTVPLGVVGVVYEPHPAVTVLAGATILKAGNAVLLRGSPAAARTDGALVALLRDSLAEACVPVDCVQALPVTERATVRYLVGAYGLVDLVVVRAGLSLARQVRADASVPLAELSPGICHVYLDATADREVAERVVLDAALLHPTRTGAAHTLLVHRDAAARLLPPLLAGLRRAGVTAHGDPEAAAISEEVGPATDNDWRDEYLTLDLAVRVVDCLESALDHIARFGTGHTEVIVTRERSVAREFAARVGAAAVNINTSTEPAELFTTRGGQARGPLVPEAFTTTKQITWA